LLCVVNHRHACVAKAFNTEPRITRSLAAHHFTQASLSWTVMSPIVTALRCRTTGHYRRLLLLMLASTSCSLSLMPWLWLLLATAKSAVMIALHIEEDDFTLGPTIPELFVAVTPQVFVKDN
jgi:hypothetical protein